MKLFKSRSTWIPYLLCGLITAVFLFGLARAAKTMYIENSFWEQVQRRLIREGRPVRAKRGNILSDDGSLLAASVPQYKIFIDFVVTDKNPKREVKEQRRRDSLFNAQVDSFALGIAQILPEVDAQKLEAHLRKGHSKKSRHWAIHPKRINYEQYQAISQLPFLKLAPGKMGFHAETFYTRVNPYGSLARRTIGKVYEGQDKARAGLELGLDSILRGKDGEMRMEKVRHAYLPIITKPAVDGFDIKTTINVRMQDIAEKMLTEKIQEVKANYGICILMEVKTGDVKAITTIRRDPKDGSCYEGENLAVSQRMEPGSVFKPISFMVAMDEGKLSKTDTYDVGGGIKEMYGRKMRDADWRSGGSGLLDVPMMLARSSNVGVATMINKAYSNNTKAFPDAIRRTGILSDFHLPIPGYARPYVPDLNPAKGVGHKVDLCWMSIGYVTQIPPIYTLSFYNAVANGGKLVRPRFYTAKMKGDEVVEEYPVVTVNEQIAKPQVIQDMQEMLRGVVTKGYGKSAGSRYFSVAGKTGTAQVWSKEGRTSNYLISFAGYFPANAPEYSMIVCLNVSGNGSGGLMCAPVFRRVAESVMALRKNTNYAQAKDSVNTLLPMASAGNLTETLNVLRLLGIQHDGTNVPQKQGLVWGRSQTTPSALQLRTEATASNLMPDLKGYGLRDAIYRLELLGLKVKHRGKGLVTSQSIPPGNRYRRGETVTLALGHAKTDSTQTKSATASTSTVPAPAPKPTTSTAKPVTTTSAPKKSSAQASTPPKKTAEKAKSTSNKPQASAPSSKEKPKSSSKTTTTAKPSNSKDKSSSSKDKSSGSKDKSSRTSLQSSTSTKKPASASSKSARSTTSKKSSKQKT